MHAAKRYSQTALAPWARLYFLAVLDPSNVSVQLDTLIKAARALGKEIEIKIRRAHKKAA